MNFFEYNSIIKKNINFFVRLSVILPKKYQFLMRKIFNVLFFSIITVLFSCQSEKVDENQLLKDEVIAIHDEVMPYMGELRSLKKEVDNKSDSLANKDAEAFAADIKRLESISKQLEDAFEGMFIWMRQFKAPEETMDEEAAKSYLLNQKELVEKVNEDIKQAMKVAKEELKSA